MLSFKYTDIYGNEEYFDTPLYVILNRDEKIPADDLTAAFPIIDLARELCYVTAYDGGEIVFKGIVDEQINVIDEKDMYTKITARSMAAALLDNESRPVSYSFPSASVIFKRHLEPNGFTSYKGEDRIIDGNLKITKGMSEWQAVSAFSIKAFGKIPVVEADGTFNFNGVEPKPELIFSNDDGIKYNSIIENNRRCKLISEVYVRTSADANYNTVLRNKSAESRGVSRRRFIDALSDSSFMTGDAMINNSDNSSYELTVTTPERILNALGAKVSFNDRETLYNNLYVSSIYYRFTPEKEETVLKIKKR